VVTTKARLLEILENNRGAFTSGAFLAAQLSVSRNAIWKAIEALREDGFIILASTNNGYRLEGSRDAISDAGIYLHLKDKEFFVIDVRKTVTSTNTVLRDIAAKGAPEGYVLAAEQQTAGKGRLGRSFHSPFGHGVYFSLLLRPVAPASDVALITPAAAVAAARAIEEVTGRHVGIKWVNDLFLGDKKVCGILTEAVFGMESGTVESAVLGIGINVTAPEEGYPDEIADIVAALNVGAGDEARSGAGARAADGAGAGVDRGMGGDVCEVAASPLVSRCALIAATLENFRGYYNDLSKKEFLDEYRARSILPGREILVLSHDSEKRARALAIDDDCRLVVEYDDGVVEALSSGEVSIRQI